MATAGTPVAGERVTKPRLLFFTSSLSGECRRVEGFLAQVLQRRRNHGTFRLFVVEEDGRPDLVSRVSISQVPTLVVVDGDKEHVRLERPRGCREIEELLRPWLR